MREMEKLNMQMPEAPQDIIAPLKRLNLMDDFLFDVTTVSLEACKIILELSIRNVGNIPKRTRFYQALVDAPLLKSGEQKFDNLNTTYIVVICGFDLFGLGKYKYTFENRCEEVPELVLGDECKKIILNTKGRNDEEVDSSLVDFLHYVENSTTENVPEECDDRLKRLHMMVEEIKASEQMGVTYMKMEERDRLLREEGREVGREEGEMRVLTTQVCKKLGKGLEVQAIAEMLEEEEPVIRRIYEAAIPYGPEYDVDKILERLNNEK